MYQAILADSRGPIEYLHEEYFTIQWPVIAAGIALSAAVVLGGFWFARRGQENQPRK